MASVKKSRRWHKMGPRGIASILRQSDIGQRYRPARRAKRWTWAHR